MKRTGQFLLLVAWLFILVAFFSTGPGCTPKPPTPVPTPTPPPEPTVQFPEMLLRTCGAGQFCHTDLSIDIEPTPVDFAGCIPCCMGLEEGNPGWPMISDTLVDFCQRQGRANFFHARPGPFLVGDEPDMTEVGGAYLEVGGRADLTQWNQPFWDWFEARVKYAGQHGGWVEVDLIDSWRLKGNCDYSPWNPARNIQGEDHCITTHRGPGDAIADAYLGKIVKTVGRYGNVIWQIGNESANVAGRGAGLLAWEKWVRDRVRAHEAEVGLGVTHMIGTNSAFDEIEAAPWIDYVNRHDLVFGPEYDKPTTCNEINPAPLDYVYDYCRARSGGAYLWAWRATLDKASWDAALAGISEARLHGCPGPKPPTVADCPKPLASGARAVLRNKPYGQGIDSTVWVIGDKELCRLVHGEPLNECHMEGWPTQERCERYLLGGCPIWQWTNAIYQTVNVCHQTEPRDDGISCDHFGSPGGQDDPHTPIFEGTPGACGLQRDGQNEPMAGFFTIAHGAGQVRACGPALPVNACGPWVAVDH